MLSNTFRASERKSCNIIDFNRSTARYKSTLKNSDQPIIERMRELALKHRRYGYPRIHILLKREGFVKNRKKTQRIYTQQELSLRLKRKKKKCFPPRVVNKRASSPNEIWSMDFVSDSLVNSRKLRSLTVIDHYSRFVPGVFVDHSISGPVVTKELDQMIIKYGRPKKIQVDNGPEFTSKAMLEWSLKNEIELIFTRPGKPTDNAFY